MKVKSEENKRKIMKNNGKLKGRDTRRYMGRRGLTFRDRKNRWILRRFEKKERKGRAVRVGYRKVWLERMVILE